jgi:mono/diheme cytochrome c family protein
MRNMFLLTLTGTLFLMAAQTKPKPKPVPAKTMAAGKKVYDTYCLVCHQQDGSGVPKMNPPLTKTTYVLGDKTKLVQVILKGMKEEVEINGEFYENVMAAHDYLTDQEIADVTTFIRNSFGNKASIITAAEVKGIRAKTK